MRIYFSGIGGVAIGPLAEIALDAGYQVVGSDASPSLTSKQLAERQVNISYSQDGSFLQEAHGESPIDWLVYTAALPDNHPELLLARQLGIKTAKRDELLAHIISSKNLRLIAISGTHGKTSTTSMLIWTMQQLGIPVSYSIGAPLSFAPSGQYHSDSQYFVYECDEFDRNFLHFHPELSIITSIDYDHPDTYPTKADYLAAFEQFMAQSQSTILWRSDATLLATEPAASWILDDSEESAAIKLAGRHVRRNATLALKACQRLQLDINSSIKALNSFPGAGRRFERLAANIYSDYGHHPKEITATLQQASELSSSVVLVYQPHQNIRQHQIHDHYTDDVFANAKIIYWLPTFLSREDPNLPILRPQQLTQRLSATKVQLANLDDQLLATIKQHQQAGDIVLLMGAGDIDSWARQELGSSS